MAKNKFQCPNCLKWPMDEVRYEDDYGLMLPLSPRIYACDTCGCVTAKPRVYEFKTPNERRDTDGRA